MSRAAFSILGAGRLGRTLGRVMARRGYAPAGVSCRSLRSARQAVAVIGGGEPTTSNARAAAGADLILITTPDGVIAPLARQLAAERHPWRGKVVAHASGALSSIALEPLRRRGARVASFHPLASVADSKEGLKTLHGIPFAIEGDARAVRTLRRLVAQLGGFPVTIPRQAKALYHLIACLLSNDLVALLSFGLDSARGLGIARREAARLYMPLVRSTVSNVARLGPVKALTGPVSRGDLTTLRLHGEALRALPADLRRLHRLLALRSAALALEARTITPEVAVRMARLLGSLP
ncbi:MAG: DUF2520 domain-containing protein [Acidobacteria bacterium]|nr:MAG: DUF2520 domain-containing protein [Acidobacteriota bacterium]